MPSLRAPSRRFANAVIAYANYAQFGPNERVLNPRVMSLMILWCKAGTGEVTVNGTTCAFDAGRYLILPWGHAVNYRASREDPFLLAGVHLIPDHSKNRPVAFEVAHTEHHPLAHAPFRRDASISELAGLKSGWLSEHVPMTHLLEYIVNLYLRGLPPEWLARQLAQQLLGEMVRCQRHGESTERSASREIERIRQYVDRRLSRQLSLRDLVEFTHLSPSTVGRLFREHLRTTPVEWITRQKMERAEVLFRTRRLSTAQVGEQVGFSDPYYFSKCFKKATGRSPRDYRKKSRWL